MAEEIIFTDYQADVFVEAEQLLKTQGYLGQPLFEDTYVLSKRLADYVIHNVPMFGGSGGARKGTNVMGEATNAYNGVLGIVVETAPTPIEIKPTQSEPIIPTVPTGGVKPPRFDIKPTPNTKPVLGGTRPPKFIPTPSWMVPGGTLVKPSIATVVAQPTPKIIPRPNYSSGLISQQGPSRGPGHGVTTVGGSLGNNPRTLMDRLTGRGRNR